MGGAAPLKGGAPPLVSLVGLSGSGKTTLVEKLIAAFAGDGLKVGSIKHSSHPHPVDSPGKDSWRHKNAGAVRTVFAGPKLIQLVSDAEGEETPETLALRYMQGLDIVLVEGFLTFNTEKIEVVRSERSEEPVSTKDTGLIAIASDIAPEKLKSSGVPVFALDDAAGIKEFIKQRFLKKG